MKQQLVFKGGGKITTAEYIKDKNMRYGELKFKGGGRIKNVRLIGLSEEGGGEDPIYKDEECLGFTAVDGNVTISLQNNGGNAPVVYYKREGQDWTLWDYSELNIADGETIRFYGDNNFIFNKSSTTYSKFNMSGNGKIEASGECNSLLSKEKTKVLTSYCFYYLFDHCDNLITIPELSATTLAASCYNGMFNGCRYITKVNDFKDAVLADSCYRDMFNSCRSLINAPKLPSITLADSCYLNMFSGCTSLIGCPDLQATTLARSCYSGMFSFCTSLVDAPELPATTLAASCYYTMFKGCTSLIKAPELSAITLNSDCYYEMFANCTSLEITPNLPALNLSSNCYNLMFKNCTKVNYIKAMFITAPSQYYTRDWLYNVATNGTFVKNSQATWDVSGSNGIPTGWTVETADE